MVETSLPLERTAACEAAGCATVGLLEGAAVSDVGPELAVEAAGCGAGWVGPVSVEAGELAGEELEAEPLASAGDVDVDAGVGLDGSGADEVGVGVGLGVGVGVVVGVGVGVGVGEGVADVPDPDPFPLLDPLPPFLGVPPPIRLMPPITMKVAPGRIARQMGDDLETLIGSASAW